MQYNYVVTAHKPSNVNLSVTGNFTGPNDLNLIVAKCNRLVIYLLTPEGLQPILDTPIYGRISTLELFRTTGAERDALCLTTERWKFCVLEYDAVNKELTTRAMGDLQDRIGKQVDSGQITHIDPNKKLVGLHLYDGLFKVIPIDPRGVLKEAFNIRLEELQVIDIQFLYVEKDRLPTILVLYQDNKEMRHLKTYEVNVENKDMSPGPWLQQGVELGATMIIPVPLPIGGAILIGEQTITHLNGDKSSTKTISMGPTVIRAWGKIDENGSRFLLGGHFGTLYVLVLEHDSSHKVLDLKLEVLGETSCASTISYLDSGVVFIGSSFGDSQLIKLHAEVDETGSNVEVLETFPNLGPIQDFCVVDFERQGQGHVVTCSGTIKDGSLRVVRNGIGINEQAQVELPGIKSMWNLRESFNSEYDKYLVQSFIGETRVLEMSDSELGETEIEGFDHSCQTIWCGNVKGDNLIQVTEKSLRLVSSSMKSLIQEWTPGEGLGVTLAAGNADQVVVATGKLLIYLSVGGGKVEELGRTTADKEISCINVSPLGVGNDKGSSTIVAVGMWDQTVHVLRLPSLETLATQALGRGVIPRSLLLVTLETVDYLLCALGDGVLFSFRIDSATAALTDQKKVSLGTQPMALTRFSSKGSTHVFASSDRPTVIYSNNEKLLFSNVNIKDVTQMTPFNSDEFADSLAIATETALTIGTIDDIQKLHIRTVPLGEQPRRICHQESARAFCVCTLKVSSDDVGEEVDEHFVKLFDDQTFELLDTFELRRWENACSLTSCFFTDDTTNFIIVGTAEALPHETEPSQGRILVFEIVDRKLRLAAEKEVKGAVYTLKAFNGKLLGGINSKIELFRMAEAEGGGKELTTECSHRGHILVLYLEAKGDFILLGDLMRSMTLLTYKPVDGQLEEIAHDFNANWMTSIDILDDDTFIGAENYYNLFTLRKNTDATTDEERARLEVVGEFHLGDLVNRFRHGSLVMKTGDADTPVIPTLIYGTVNGVIGVIASLPKEDFDFMLKVQTALNTVIKGVGGFRHEDWRSFQSERVVAGRPSKGFLDGDLIESYLDLRRDKMAEVARAVGVTADELCKRVEDLQRLH